MPETKVMAGPERNRDGCTIPGTKPRDIGVPRISRDTTGRVVFDCTKLDNTRRICLPLAALCPVKDIITFSPIAKEEPIITCETNGGIISLDKKSGSVRTPFIETPAHLTPTEMTMLLLLMRHPGELCSYKHLYQAVHDGDFTPDDYGVGVRIQMNRLRSKLEDRKMPDGEWTFIANRKQGEFRGYQEGGYYLIMSPPPGR